MEREIYFAGGCFWGVERYFSLVEGVIDTCVGYANGHVQSPTYESVCTGETGHAETVRVWYDPDRVRLSTLLELFFQIIDPTAQNRQGPDIGSQYRTGVFYVDPHDLPAIQRSLMELEARVGRPLAVVAEPLRCFFPAEAYHQRYLEKHPYGYCHIDAGAFARARAAQGRGFARRSDQELRAQLTNTQYRVTQEAWTEPPFQNAYYNIFDDGIYVDVTTGEPLFSSRDKFDAGCGWPSFSRPIDDALIRRVSDHSHGMERTEVRSRLGGAHLGHVFEDGPEAMGGLRYCINSAALRFIPKEDLEAEGYGAYRRLFDDRVETDLSNGD